MNYRESLEYLFSPHTPAAWDRRENYHRALTLLGDPHKGLKYIHVAGTNGKGSVCAFLFSVLQECGLQVGLFTSPHIHRFNERIRVNQAEISDEDTALLLSQVRTVNERLMAEGYATLRTFEMITLAGFLYFRQQKCDVVVLEVGLGGRLDATNCIRAEDVLVSVITAIGLDHEELLGHTIPEIAGEKAGIIKDQTDVVLMDQEEDVLRVVDQACRAHNAKLHIADWKQAEPIRFDLNESVFRYHHWDPVQIRLIGSYESANACTALSCCEILKQKKIIPSDDPVYRGMSKARWGGRFELLHTAPAVIADGCHNAQGIRAFLEGVSSLLPERKFTIIMGILADKEITETYPLLHQYGQSLLITTPPSDRALPAEELIRRISRVGNTPVVSFPSMEEALQTAMDECSANDVVLVMGSLYQISSVRAFFGRKSFYTDHS